MDKESGENPQLSGQPSEKLGTQAEHKKSTLIDSLVDFLKPRKNSLIALLIDLTLGIIVLISMAWSIQTVVTFVNTHNSQKDDLKSKSEILQNKWDEARNHDQKNKSETLQKKWIEDQLQSVERGLVYFVCKDQTGNEYWIDELNSSDPKVFKMQRSDLLAKMISKKCSIQVAPDLKVLTGL